MRLRAAAIGFAAVGVFGSGCRCGSSEPDPVGGALQVASVPVAPPPSRTELPAERPKRFSISYSTETDVGESEHLLLGNVGARQGSKRRQRGVQVIYSPNGPIVEKVYGELTKFACDKVETELRRTEPEGGSTMQITAGTMRKMVNDKAPFHPTQAWAGAYAGCASALEHSFPVPGSSGYAELELRFPAEEPPDAIGVELDLGPDHRGIEWRDDGATGIVYVAKLRPVDLAVSSGGGTTTVSLELATQRGVEIAVKSDAVEGELAVTVTAIAEPAATKGTVLSGPNARITTLGGPRLDFAGEPAAPRPLRAKAGADAKAPPAGTDEQAAPPPPE